MKPRQSQRTSRIGSKSESKKGARLYALAKGKGGSMSVGLYKEHWDKLSFLVEGYSKGRLIKVATPKEGMKYINSYYKDRGLSRPKWIKDKEEHYPSLKKIRRFLRKSHSSSSDSSSDTLIVPLMLHPPMKRSDLQLRMPEVKGDLIQTKRKDQTHHSLSRENI